MKKQKYRAFPPRCLNRYRAAMYAGMSEDDFLAAVKTGVLQGPLFGGVPEEVYDRAAIDFALGREYDEYSPLAWPQ